MAFREVTMLEVKEILRLWLSGVPKNRVPSYRARLKPGQKSGQKPEKKAK